MPTTPRRGKSVASTYESPAARCVSHRPRLALTIRDLRYVRPPPRLDARRIDRRGGFREGTRERDARVRGRARAHTHTSNDDTR